MLPAEPLRRCVGVIVHVPLDAHIDASACRRRHDLVPYVDAGRLRHSSYIQNYLDWLGSHTWKANGEIFSFQGKSEMYGIYSLLLKCIAGPGNGYPGS